MTVLPLPGNGEMAPTNEGAVGFAAARKASIQIGPPDTYSLVNRMTQSYAKLGYQLPWEILDIVELLAQLNPDYSQAVDNIRTLANSGYDLHVEGRSDLQTRRLKERFEEKARTIQAPFGGLDGLVDKLLRMSATYGAMCGEWILNDNMDDVVDFVDVNPKTIRFFWEDEHWAPYQKVSFLQAKEAESRGQKVVNSCVKLNELTFRYFAFDAAPGSPYGTPPFIAALRNIAIQNNMVENMAQIVKKIGLLGIIDLVVKQLPRTMGEDDEAYAARAGSYLDAYVSVIEDMVRDGGIAHYDDVELKTTQLTGNAAGATNIFKQNEELIFSGLKSMPSVQGRSYSTTETYAGVAYDIIIRNTRKYQRACKRMLESGHYLMADVWGLQVKGIALDFHENKSLQRLQDAQARRLEILNQVMVWLMGLVNQDHVAQALGYDEPDTPLDAPPAATILGTQVTGR